GFSGCCIGIQVGPNLSYDIKFYGIIGDCPALKLILNFIGHTGYYCCFLCYIRGTHIMNKRQYFFQQPLMLRGTTSYLEESRKAERNRTNEFGHLGTNILEEILDVPLPQAIIIDYLHVTLLRHTKAIVTELYALLKPAERQRLDISLKQQRFPHFFNRKMRAIKDLSYVKATELRNMLLYGLLPNFYLFLSLETIAHFALYVCGIRLLHGKRVFDTKTSMMADQLLCRYYEDHEHYYTGLQNLVLHLHSHYSPQYDDHGAFCNRGTFGQEDLIGHISSNRHGTRYYGELITYYYSIDFSLHNKTERKIAPNGLTDETNQNADTYGDLDRYHQQICGCNTINKCIAVYRRCVIRDHMYHSLLYNKRQTSVSYFVQYCVNNDNKQHRFWDN
ncbi:unnamed protein product, partial [Didymodactylos carnosus]